MILSLRPQNFRSYKDETFEFGPGVNIIVGPNASGKTNLLEALQVICSGHSYRGKDKELIQFEQDWARLAANDDQKERLVIIENEGVSTKKRYSINGQKLSRLPLNKTLPVVLFQPEHLRLVTGAPERRREFIDDLLEQTISGFGSLRRSYSRALAQRNKLLKQDYWAGKKQLFAWDVRLSELAGQIVAYRHELIKKFNEQANDLYQKIAHSTKKVVLSYQTSCPPKNYTSHLLSHLEAHEEQDFERGFTSYGPHREDMQILLGGHLAQESASRGESRTLVLVFKILELKILEESRGKAPLLLLDDVFSELDGARRKTLTTFLNNYQTFITTTDADIVVKHFMSKSTIIPTNIR